MREVLTTEEGEVGGGWKALVFDNENKALLSYFKLGDLREMNVALHLHLEEKKSSLQGVKGVYLLAPTAESVEFFLSDLRGLVFEDFYLNFSRPIDQSLLTRLCDSIISAGRTSNVRKIRQFFMTALPLTSESFTLGCPANHADLPVKLATVLAAENLKPIFAFDKASQAAAELAEATRAAVDRVDPSRAPNRPTLVILSDGQGDFLPGLLPSMLYGQLLSEQFGAFESSDSFNTLHLDGQSSHVDLRGDKFFYRHSTADLPTAALALSDELGAYKSKFEALEGRGSTENVESIAENFSEKIEKIPEMTELRKRNKFHTRVCQTLLSSVRSQGLDEFARLVESARKNRDLPREALTAALSVGGGPAKTRLFFGLAAAGLSSSALKPLADSARQDSARHAKGIDLQMEKIEKEEKATGAKQASGGLLAGLKGRGMKFLADSLGSSAEFESTRALRYFIKGKKEFYEKFALDPPTQKVEGAPLQGIEVVVIFNLSAGGFPELVELKEVAKELKVDVVYGTPQILTPEKVVDKYVDFIDK